MSFHRILHRKRVDHRTQHTDVIGAYTVHTASGERRAAKDVAGTDHHSHLHAGFAQGPYVCGKPVQSIGIYSELRLTLQSLTGELEQNSFVFELPAAHPRDPTLAPSRDSGIIFIPVRCHEFDS